MPEPEFKELLTLSQAALLFGVRRKLLRDHVDRGNLKAYPNEERRRVGRPAVIMVKAADVRKWLKRREQAPVDTAAKNDPYLPLADVADAINVQPIRLYRAIRNNEIDYKINDRAYNPGKGRAPRYLIKVSVAKQWKIDNLITNHSR